MELELRRQFRKQVMGSRMTASAVPGGEGGLRQRVTPLIGLSYSF
jgi:hypothetical protein